MSQNNPQPKTGDRDKKGCRFVLMNPPTSEPVSSMLLNLGYLSAALKAAGHETLFIDATAKLDMMTEERVAKAVREFAPDVIGVTLTIANIDLFYQYMPRLKELGIPVVAGGPHPNCLAEEVIEHGVDIAVIGEAEVTIVELAEHFCGRKDLEDIKGLCFKDDTGTLVRTPPRGLTPDIDTLPFPDYSSFEPRRYTSEDPKYANNIWNLFTSRGCPFNCTFCSSHNVFGRTYRARTPEIVFKEIMHLHREYGAHSFSLQDDEAFIKPDRIIRFCDLVRESGLPLRFSARMRIDSISVPMLQNMEKAGFTRLSFGLESLNDESLKKINKKYTFEIIREGFKKIADSGFPIVSFSNLVGFPWETRAHLRQMAEAVQALDPRVIYSSVVVTPIPYPGTELYEAHHTQFGFTNWWLDTTFASNLRQRKIPDAFFTIYAMPYEPLWFDNPFWNYDDDFRDALVEFSWSVFDSVLKRRLNSIERAFVLASCKLSHKLWKRSPALERIAMAIPKLIGKALGLPLKIAFVPPTSK
jgi:Fe-S oxidoreductase